MFLLLGRDSFPARGEGGMTPVRNGSPRLGGRSAASEGELIGAGHQVASYRAGTSRRPYRGEEM